MTKVEYDVLWDIGDVTKHKSYGSKWEAFEKFKELQQNEDVLQVDVIKGDSGYRLHHWLREDLRGGEQ